MPGGQGDARTTDPFIGPVVLALAVLAYVVVGRAAGLTWKTLLHWAGESLLIVGILLAAKGISDVRREWTGLPGIRGRAHRAVQAIRARAASFLWACWNWIARWRWLASRLHLRPHRRVVSGSAVLSGSASLTATATAKLGFGPPPAAGTVEERLAWLEAHIAQVWAQIDILNERHQQEIRDRQDATGQERAERAAEVQRIRDSIANLAGGGLRLQAWGVVCLLVGTIMTAIW